MKPLFPAFRDSLRRPNPYQIAPANAGSPSRGVLDITGPAWLRWAFGETMKRLLHIWALLLLLPCTVIGADPFSLTVTNTKVANQQRYVTADVRLSEKVSVTKETILLVVVGRTRPGGPPDEFGPPQNFALRGTSHEIEPRFFRVEVALPLEKVSVKFMLTVGKKVLYEQTRQL